MEGFASSPPLSAEPPSQQVCDPAKDEVQRLNFSRKLLFSSSPNADSSKQQDGNSGHKLMKPTCPVSEDSRGKMSVFSSRSLEDNKSVSNNIQPSLYGWMLNSGTWKGHYTNRRRRWGHHLGQDFRALHSARYNALYRRNALGPYGAPSCYSAYPSQPPPPPLLPLHPSEGASTVDFISKVPPPLLPISDDTFQEVVHQHPSVNKSQSRIPHPTHSVSGAGPSVPYSGTIMPNTRLCDSSAHHHHHHHPLQQPSSSSYLDLPQTGHCSYHSICSGPQSLQAQYPSKWSLQHYTNSRPEQHRCCDRLCPLRQCQQLPSASHLYSLPGNGTGGRNVASCNHSSPFDIQRSSVVSTDYQTQYRNPFSFPGVPPIVQEELSKGTSASHLHYRY